MFHLSILKKLKLNFAYALSRKEASAWMAQIVKLEQGSKVSAETKQKIKRYARLRFGSEDFWPWLAWYTEVRGEWIEGWVPKDFYANELLPKWNPRKFAYLSRLKTMNDLLLREYMIPSVGYRISDVYFDSKKTIINEEKFKKLASKYDEIVLKEDDSSGGAGVHFIPGGAVELSQFRGNISLQEPVRQHDALKKLNPTSLNTLRLVTFIENGQGLIRVLFRLLRVGVGGSRTDNRSAGALGVYLDAMGVAITNGCNKYGLQVETHPDHKYLFKEISYPWINEAERICSSAHLLLPWFRIIAWDVVVTETSNVKLLEWNAVHPGFELNEAICGPFFPTMEFF